MPKIPTRKEWQKLRDTNKVPSGAVKGVNIGESIDAVFKTASLATLTKHEQATNALLADLDAYMAAIAAKYPTFVPIVRKQVKLRVNGHVAALAMVKKGLAVYYKRYQTALDAHRAVVKGTGSVKALSVAMEDLLGPASVFGEVDQKWVTPRTAMNKMMSQVSGNDTLSPEELRNIYEGLKRLDPQKV